MNSLEEWYTLKDSKDNGDKKKVEDFGEEGQKCFIATLHFEGFNNIRYLDVQKDFHNQLLLQGKDMMPMRINHMI